MTNLEYITALLGRFGLGGPELTAALLSQGLQPGDPADPAKVKLAAYHQIPIMLAGIQNVTEGGYSIKWNLEGIKAWYAVLANELGQPDILNIKPTLTYIGNRW